jgi:hypothetical protein
MSCIQRRLHKSIRNGMSPSWTHTHASSSSLMARSRREAGSLTILQAFMTNSRRPFPRAAVHLQRAYRLFVAIRWDIYVTQPSREHYIIATERRLCSTTRSVYGRTKRQRCRTARHGTMWWHESLKSKANLADEMCNCELQDGECVRRNDDSACEDATRLEGDYLQRHVNDVTE